MGYLFLSLALAFGTVKAYCGKRTSDRVSGTSSAILVNTVRIGICILIGFGMVVFGGKLGALSLSTELFLIYLLSGLTTGAFIVTWLLSVRQGAFAMVDVFLLVSVIIPMLLSSYLYSEEIRPIQWIGIALLIVSGYIMSTYNKSIKGKMSLSAKILLVICMISYGFSNFSQKLFVNYAPTVDVAVFNFYTYLFAGPLLVIFYFLFRAIDKKDMTASPARLIKSIWLYILIMAVCLFLNSYFMTCATKRLDATELYPLSQGSCLVISLLLSAIFFNEKINLKAIIGIVCCFVSLLMINIL